ncbi:YxeA family protein [Lactiplantibacillus plajomi]|uniref:YxeA family protein n=1 Tax=Lactiplantibacillus plajomi TaxID=1457217 RepID=A0ABV6K0Q2_9LACO|nr:YxeA family protein [Lactiplantibacillus plajomi]
MKKLLLGLVALIVVAGGALLFSSHATKDQGTELAMALDNVNPMVKESTVYGLTNEAVSHTKGQMGEDVFTYKMRTVDVHGNERQLTFTADHRLKLNHYLKIDTKGQNVNSWEAVQETTVPSIIRTGLNKS